MEAIVLLAREAGQTRHGGPMACGHQAGSLASFGWPPMMARACRGQGLAFCVRGKGTSWWGRAGPDGALYSLADLEHRWKPGDVWLWCECSLKSRTGRIFMDLASCPQAREAMAACFETTTRF